MWRLSVASLSAAILGAAAYSLSPTPAYTCSAGLDFDPVASSTIIVEGRFLGYQVVPGEPMPGSEEARRGSSTIPVEIEMRVERVLKGNVSTSMLAFVDRASLSSILGHNGEHQWWGSGGGCGAFDADPTGVYAVMGLSLRDDGTFGSNRLQVFYMGDGPGGAGYDRALQRMASFPGAAALPALGSGPGADDTGGFATVVVAGAVVTIGVALLGLVALSRFRIRRSA